MRHFRTLIALAALVATAVGCNPEPDKSTVEFASQKYGYTENQVYGYVALLALNTPEKFPIIVDVKVTYESGADDKGNELTLKDIILFDRGDEESYTVEYPDDNTAIISGIEVTYSQYNKKLYFSIVNRDFLQQETSKVLFDIIDVKGSVVGQYKQTMLTIVDDEHAPRVKTPYYKTEYTPLEGSVRDGRGSFFLRLDKVGKKEYVASNWFGLPRPRLYGVYDPAKQTITFTRDYDHKLWFSDGEAETQPSVFQNDTIWYYDKEKTKVLRLFAGVNKNGPLVINTEKIDENKSGVVIEVSVPCGFEIYNYNGSKPTDEDFVGYYDAMNRSTKMTYFEVNYDENDYTQQSRLTENDNQGPMAFGNWQLAPIEPFEE